MASAQLESLITQIALDLSKLGPQVEQASAYIESLEKKSQKSSENIEKNTGMMAKGFDSLKSVLGAVGLAMGAKEVLDFAVAQIKAADAIDDMAQKLGLTREEVQRFSYAADLGGSSIEGVDKAIGIMSRNLAEGSTKTKGAIKDLGLSFDEIRAMSPGEEFRVIGDAIGALPTPMLQAKAATEIFGKSGAEMLGMFQNGITKTGNDVHVMADSTVRSLAAVSDMWTKLWTSAKAYAGDAVAWLVNDVSQGMLVLGESVGGLGKMLKGDFSGGWKQITGSVQTANRVLAENEAMSKKTAEQEAKLTAERQKAGVEILKQQEAEDKATEAKKKAAEAAKQYTAELKKMSDQLFGLDTSDAAKKWVEIAKGHDLSKVSAENAKQALKDLNEEIERLKASGKAVPADMQKMRDTLTDITVHAAAVKISLQNIDNIPFNNGKTYFDNLTESINKSAKEAEALGEQWERESEAELRMAEKASDAAEKQRQEAQAQSALVRTNIQNIATSLTQMATISQGAFGSVAKSTGTALTGFLAADAGVKSFDSGLSAIQKGGAKNMLSGITGIVGGVGSMISVAETAIQVFKNLFGAAGRHMVEDFAKTFEGGFDGLHARLMALGPAGEQQWKNLTQNVARNNKEAAEAAIKATEDMLEKADQKFNDTLSKQLQGIKDFGVAMPAELQPYLDKLMESGRITEDNIALMEELSGGGEVSWKKMEDAANKYGIEVGTLGNTFQQQRLHDGWQELINDAKLLVDGGADVNGMLSGMADEISKLVQDSKKFGTDIPENMRPYIQALIDSGQLLDENGEKITDINSLQFGAEIKDSVAELIEEIKKLVETLGGVPSAIKAIPKDVDINVNYRQNKYGEAPEGDDIPQFASGVTNFRGGLAWVGEQGPELVRLPRGSDVIPNGAIGGVTNHITIEVAENGSGGPGWAVNQGDIIGRQLVAILNQQGYRR